MHENIKKNQSHFHFYQLLSPKMIDKKKPWKIQLA